MRALSASKLPDGVRVDRPEAHLPRAFTRRSPRTCQLSLVTARSLACYKPPSVTALSSAAATAKERAGSIP